ncbi:LysR substrate-binding domain-containing protein [Sneathiella chinensis]|uniref:LysR substrate-binding domain-containing protein n=1 Tax=Sneathiella chinensis TaxID=349750 RepID=UPI00146D44FE|nr:LysR substrate-binding domain-containing protein [Sneathiella chinensis]
MSGLKAFEAACRYLSFNQAAEELNVTPGAVSRQIQSLEHYLGKPLFHRHHKRIELTAVGRQYYAEISTSLEKIAAASNRIRSEPRRDKISICAYPTFAIRWLIPHWPALYKAFPGLDIQLTTSLNPADFEQAGFDISIQVLPDGETKKGFVIDKLLDVITYPVCSPELADRVSGPQDLEAVTLLHESPRPTDWPRWLKTAGITTLNPNQGLNFESNDMALHAAREGLGVAIAIDALVQSEVRSGHLVRLFDVSRRSRFPFQLVSPARSANDPTVRALRAWLVAEGEKSNRASQ